MAHKAKSHYPALESQGGNIFYWANGCGCRRQALGLPRALLQGLCVPRVCSWAQPRLGSGFQALMSGIGMLLVGVRGRPGIYLLSGAGAEVAAGMQESLAEALTAGTRWISREQVSEPLSCSDPLVPKGSSSLVCTMEMEEYHLISPARGLGTCWTPRSCPVCMGRSPCHCPRTRPAAAGIAQVPGCVAACHTLARGAWAVS